MIPDIVSTVIQRVLYPGAVAVDVGANVGTYTLEMANLVGEDGLVIAIEPHPTFAQRGSGLPAQVLKLQCAVGSRPYMARVMFASERKDNAGITSLCMDGGRKGYDALVYRLDDLLRPLQRLDLIKIDTEGMELDVLCGATETMARLKPVFVFETLYPFQYDRPVFASIKELFTRNGYVMVSLEAGNVVPADLDRLDSDTIAFHKDNQPWVLP